MAGDPTQAISTALIWIREVSIIGAILFFGWKARAAWQDVIDFTKEVRKHMRTMNRFAHVVVENHLRHIERDIARLNGDEPSADLPDVSSWDEDSPLES